MKIRKAIEKAKLAREKEDTFEARFTTKAAIQEGRLPPVYTESRHAEPDYKKMAENKCSALSSESPYPDAFRVAWMYLGGTLLCAVWLGIAGDPALGSMIRPGVPWGWLIYLGCIASGVGFYCWNRGARVVRNSGLLAVMNNAYIPLAIVVNLSLFGEQADWFRLLPGSIVLGLSLLLVWRIEHRPAR